MLKGWIISIGGVEIANHWYSSGLMFREAKYLDKQCAKIADAYYAHSASKDNLVLTLDLVFDNELNHPYRLRYDNDIKELLIRTGAISVSQLEGKIVEVYSEEGVIKGISVSEH